MSDWWSSDAVAEANPTTAKVGTGAFGRAISAVESGGRYDALGPATRTGDRAFGKYQVMGANVPSWTEEAIGRRMTPREFLASPEAQDAVFNHRFGGYADKYGPEGAAKAWFAGEKGMNNPNARDVLGTTVASYGRQFMQGMNREKQQTAPAAVQAASGGGWWDSDPVIGPSAPTGGAVERQPLPPPAETPQAVPGPNGVTRVTVTPPEDSTGDVARFGDVGQPADVGRGNAFLRGAYQGVTANFGDEIAGVNAAGPDVALPGPGALLRPLIGGARIGYEALTGQRGPATQQYEAARDQVRQDTRTAEQQYPGTTMVGNVAGAVALPGGALMRGAGLGAQTVRAGLVGAGYGAAAGAGEGETPEERAAKAASGGALGAVAGGAAPTVLRAVGGVGSAIGAAAAPVVNRVRGAINPETEASRRVATAISRDTDSWEGLQRASQMAAAGQQGAPVAIADLGGETTRALARSAANTSTEGREALQALTQSRFGGQADRAVAFINRLVGNTDTAMTREAIDAAQIAANRPAYRLAYSRPAAQSMWDESLETLASAPIMQNAIRQANVTSRNAAAREGQAPGLANPFTFDRTTGAMSLRTGPNGETMTPNLAFWDAVKKNLDGMGAEGRQMSKVLRDHLDTVVPEYQAARQGAARFFGAEDALEAGEKFITSNMSASEGARALAKMTAGEKALFRQGAAANLIDVVNKTGDSRNVVNRIGQSPEARRKLEVALGADGAEKVKTHIEVESVMDKLRTAVQGNSTTARQLFELGLAGGAGSYATGDYSPQTFLASALTYGVARKGAAKIDERVARRVAEMLSSSDPAVLARGIQSVQKSKALTEAFRALDTKLGSITGQQGTGVVGPSALGISRAEDNEPGRPRPGGQ